MTTHWEERAACTGTMLELWYGTDDYDEPRDQARWRRRRASEFCAICPVWTECLAEELVRPLSQQHGIRGGLTPRARERLLARWRAASLVPEHGPPGDVEFVRTLLSKTVLPSNVRYCHRS
ncbi:WhiB family transcriptional regulator [Parasphingorhabdus pacifica]